MENYYDPALGDWVTAESRYRAVADAPPYDRLDDHLYGHEPDRAWRLLIALLHAVDDDLVSLVGAGPLESFLYLHGAAFAGQVEAAARDDDRFRRAVLEVNLARGHLPPEVEARFLAAFGARFQLLPPHDPDYVL